MATTRDDASTRRGFALESRRGEGARRVLRALEVSLRALESSSALDTSPVEKKRRNGGSARKKTPPPSSPATGASPFPSHARSSARSPRSPATARTSRTSPGTRIRSPGKTAPPPPPPPAGSFVQGAAAELTATLLQVQRENEKLKRESDELKSRLASVGIGDGLGGHTLPRSHNVGPLIDSFSGRPTHVKASDVTKAFAGISAFVQKRSRAQAVRKDVSKGEFKCLVPLEDMKTAIAACAQHMNDAASHRQMLESKLDDVTLGGSLEKEIAHLQKDIGRLERERAAAIETAESMRAENSRLVNELEEVRNTDADLDALRSENASLREKLRELPSSEANAAKQTRGSNADSDSDSTERISQLESELASQQEAYMQLYENYNTLNGYYAQVTEQLQQQQQQ